MKDKHFISNKDERARIFKTDFIEALSKTHWTIPLWVFVPIVCYFLYLTFDYGVLFFTSLLLFLIGLFVWTFAEYFMHRVVFHYQPKSKFGKWMHWVMHGVHHDYPQDSKRLVLPPGMSLPLAAMFYFLFYMFIPQPELFPYFAGFLVGYLIYDIGHYALHHFSFNGRIFKKVKLHHMKHHYVEPNADYGVSSPLWDIIFRTRGKAK